MSARALPAKSRSEFSLTSASTLHHLIVAGLGCAGLWTIIIATFGV